MEKIIIHGPTRLEGEVTISGTKNAAVAIIPATLLLRGSVIIHNVPNISDVNIFCEILEELGTKIERIDEHTLKIDSRKLNKVSALSDNVKKLRASYYILGALLGREKSAVIGLPGGCNIGARPIDLHIKGFENLGAEVVVDAGMVSAKAKKLVGKQMYLDIVSVGATINIMMSAVLAEGTTIIENAAKEPHVVDVANFLNTLGADIRGAGTDIIKINGVKELVGDYEYSILPDQIETGTFMIAAAVSRGNVLIKNCIPKHVEALTSKLIEMGATVVELGDKIRVKCDKKLKKCHIRTQPHPGFATDLQSQMGVALALADGVSSITENIWENRFQYTKELNNMGADIEVVEKKAIFHGVDKLEGTIVQATDLRAGVALIIAGIVANGKTEIRNVEYIDRGYEKIEQKFKGLGAKIERLRK